MTPDQIIENLKLLRFRVGTGRLFRRVEGGGETEWLEAINRPVLIALLGSAAFLSVKWRRPLM